MKIRETVKFTFFSAAIAAAPVGARLAPAVVTQLGNAKIGAVAGVGAAGLGIKALVSGAAKVGSGTAMKVGAGTVLKTGAGVATKAGVGTTFKVGAGYAAANSGVRGTARLHASQILERGSLNALKSQPQTITTESFPRLYRKYPELSNAIGNPAKIDDLVRQNPQFSNDLSLAMYRRNPQMFAPQLKDNVFLNVSPKSFDDALHAKVQSNVNSELEEVIRGTTRRLEQEGFDLAQLSSMDRARLEKSLADALIKEIDSVSTTSGYQWGYNSGKLFVRGDIGHFSFSQELALGDLVMAGSAAAAGATGYKYAWQNESFDRAENCADELCTKVSDDTELAENRA